MKKVLTHRFLKFLLVLIIASAIQYLYSYSSSASKADFSVGDFFTKLYSSNLMFAYWYLYAHLAFLLMLPLLRCLAKAMTEREYLWMYALYGILQLLSIIEYLIWNGEHTLNRNAAFFISINTVFYPLLGYYIDRVMDRRFFTGKTLLLLTLASFVGIAVCCMMTLYKRRFTEEMNIPAWETFFYTLNFLPATTAFLAAKCIS